MNNIDYNINHLSKKMSIWYYAVPLNFLLTGDDVMKSIVKYSLLIGFIFGAILGLGVSLSLDFMMSGASDAGWYASVQHDVTKLLGQEWADKKWFIYTGVVGVIGFITIVGGVLGAASGALIGKFFSFIGRS